MSDSPRKLIRQAVWELLSTPKEGVYPTPCQDRVYPSRVLDLPREALPALCIYTLNADPGEDQDLAGTLVEQTLRLAVEVHAAGGEADTADLVDDISWTVERLVSELSLDDPEIREVRWEGWTLAQDASGALVDGVAISTFAITFLWRKPEAEYELADFKRIHGTMMPAPAGDQPAEEFRAELEA
jgi:hypothetical protein